MFLRVAGKLLSFGSEVGARCVAPASSWFLLLAKQCARSRKLPDSIGSNTLIGVRDRALIGTMVYSFARVGATVTMKVGDYFQHRKRLWLRLHEKGGKR